MCISVALFNEGNLLFSKARAEMSDISFSMEEEID